jgi:DNA-directed RNA polymerase subunit RPC12/RpoP
MEGSIIVLSISIVIFIIGYLMRQNGGGSSGIDVICPKCKNKINVPGDGEYTCPVCNHRFVYGETHNIGVVCPSCGKQLFVPKAGIYNCPDCNNDFSYLDDFKVRVKCPNCFKFIFVNGEGKHTCTKCHVEFNYGEQNSDTINSIQDNLDYKKYCDVLGCGYDATEEEINQKYKEMVMKFHPDKIISKDLPEELIQFSTQKFIDIKEAYEKIKARRADKLS